MYDIATEEHFKWCKLLDMLNLDHVVGLLDMTDKEEQELVNFLYGCAQMGYAKTRKDVLAIVERIMAFKGKEVQSATDTTHTIMHLGGTFF